MTIIGVIPRCRDCLMDGYGFYKTGNHTIIAAELNTSNERGGYDIPILYVADNKNGMIINRFGQDGLFTRYADG